MLWCPLRLLSLGLAVSLPGLEREKAIPVVRGGSSRQVLGMPHTATVSDPQ